MADFALYVDSLQDLSVALEKIMALTSVRKQIKVEYSRIPIGAEVDHKAIIDALFDAMPRVTRLQAEEKELNSLAADYVSRSIKTALRYVLSLEKEDVEDRSLNGLQKHLQILVDVLDAHYIHKGDSNSIDEEQFDQALQKLDTFPIESQVSDIRDIVLKLKLLTISTDVGKK